MINNYPTRNIDLIVSLAACISGDDEDHSFFNEVFDISSVKNIEQVYNQFMKNFLPIQSKEELRVKKLFSDNSISRTDLLLESYDLLTETDDSATFCAVRAAIACDHRSMGPYIIGSVRAMAEKISYQDMRKKLIELLNEAPALEETLD